MSDKSKTRTVQDIMQDLGATASPEEGKEKEEGKDKEAAEQETTLKSGKAPEGLGIESHDNELYEELQAAQDLAKDNWDKYLRLQAEMKNMQDRNDRKIEDARKFAIKPILEQLLDVLDSLELALQATDGNDDKVQALREGVELTLSKFIGVMEKYGVKQLNPIGESFDPQLHEAMSMQASEEVEAGMIITVLQKGYILDTRLIRPARVIVAQ
jgi:molecular chaperone GrpE